jgi:hypothetical protein
MNSVPILLADVAEALPASDAFRPLAPPARHRGGAAPFAPRQGVRMSLIKSGRSVRRLAFYIGADALAALGARPGERLAILVAPDHPGPGGRPVIWLRRAAKAEHPAYRLRLVKGMRSAVVGLTAPLAAPITGAAAQRFAPHPAGGLIVWPEGPMALAVAAIAAARTDTL